MKAWIEERQPAYPKPSTAARPKQKPQQLSEVAGVFPEWLRGPATTETDIHWSSPFDGQVGDFSVNFGSLYHPICSLCLPKRRTGR
jgi:hypothetical protein